MKVLVTGGAGFIGSHIVDALVGAGHTVAVLDDLSSGSRENLPEGVDVYEADIQDAAGVDAVFDAVRPDWVSHQAAQISVSRSVNEPAYDATVNVVGLLNVLTSAQRVGVTKVVFASSGGAIYGDVTVPATEQNPGNPISPYGITKWVGERYLQFFNQMHGMQCVAMRYANVYGPRQNPHGEAGVVAVFSTRMLTGEPTRVNGDGKYLRDYVYVGDVARANLAAFETDLEQGFAFINVGTAQGTDVNELAELIRQSASKELQDRGETGEIAPPGFGPARPGDIRSSLIDPSLAAELLDWKPTVFVREGLPETVAWFAQKLLATQPDLCKVGT
ncbi:MAG: NAD-dependent epimerase/dehydratase family protein [Planctomycetaceae bacterium]